MNRDVTLDVNWNDIFLGDLTSSTTYEYWGYARPGAVSSSAEWKIMRYEKNSDGIVIAKTWAGGTPTYTQVWDLRTTYVYQ